MTKRLRLRRVLAIAVLIVVVLTGIVVNPDSYNYETAPAAPTQPEIAPTSRSVVVPSRALDALETLAIKGRASKTDYARRQFGDGWTRVGVCDMRNIILNRDLDNAVVNDQCKVISGVLTDPYTAQRIQFVRGDTTSDDVQIDHVVALSDAWQKGAQQLDLATRIALANDPLELLAVDGDANQAKSAGDAATWLPPNKSFRCQYIARQIAVKAKYHLWVTDAEKQAMSRVLSTCPDQLLPINK